MKRVVTLGTLREDIVIGYDFSVPMDKMEKELIKLKKTIGGSVHNTCYFLASYDYRIEVTLCTLNYFDLVEALKRRICCDNYNVLTTSEVLCEYPLSIIGLKNDGDKQMISYDPKTEEDGLMELFGKESRNADVLYTSFYEINERNYESIAKIFSEALNTEKVIMVDLCPLLCRINDNVLRTVLSKTTIISGNEIEFETLTQRICQGRIEYLFKEFPQVEGIYVKKGKLGASLYTQSVQGEIAELFIKVKEAETQNTTGCGDVFNAVLIDCFLNNEQPGKALEYAVDESEKIAEGGLPWIKE